jgi:hypothetical protein
MPKETVHIKFKDVELEVEGDYTPYDAGVWRDSNGDGLPPSPSEFEIQKILWECEETKQTVDVFDIYESLDKIYDISEIAIEEIEKQ